jgi:hypothetical protein
MSRAQVTVKAVVDIDPETKRLLADVRDRLPLVGNSAAVDEPATAYQAILRGRLQALEMVRDAAESWCESAREEQAERWSGAEGWDQLHIQDVRSIIRDSAERLGLLGFRAGPPAKEKA